MGFYKSWFKIGVKGEISKMETCVTENYSEFFEIHSYYL